MKDHCCTNRIKQEFSCHYIPQRNGVAESINKTLMAKTRALFIDSNLPKYLWDEALSYATRQLNRSPTKTLRGNTSVNVMYGINTQKNLVVFVSKAWTVILPKQGRFEPIVNEVRMVGYGGSGWPLWDLKTDETINLRHVKFDESSYVYYETVKITSKANVNTNICIVQTEEEIERDVDRNGKRLKDLKEQ